MWIRHPRAFFKQGRASGVVAQHGTSRANPLARSSLLKDQMRRCQEGSWIVATGRRRTPGKRREILLLMSEAEFAEDKISGTAKRRSQA